jgi:hypothetical protein
MRGSVQGTNLAVNPIFGSRLGVLGGSITSFFLIDLNPSDLRCPIFPSLLAAGGGGGQIPPTPDPMILGVLDLLILRSFGGLISILGNLECGAYCASREMIRELRPALALVHPRSCQLPYKYRSPRRMSRGQSGFLFPHERTPRARSQGVRSFSVGRREPGQTGGRSSDSSDPIGPGVRGFPESSFGL